MHVTCEPRGAYKKKEITQTPTLFFKANRKHKVLFDLKRKHPLISLPEFVLNAQ